MAEDALEYHREDSRTLDLKLIDEDPIGERASNQGMAVLHLLSGTRSVRFGHTSLVAEGAMSADDDSISLRRQRVANRRYEALLMALDVNVHYIHMLLPLCPFQKGGRTCLIAFNGAVKAVQFGHRTNASACRWVWLDEM
eukprot:CAMPEP_0174760368 /NCGR_PEP_ID=MMETSP1094-20130205/108736_1 /TAXON_ID=156173 /ORGANISM="Chrysochromulina brevifilum, Strain UTEX LB 985" /LENGTH=139 /DNA_ID=CAMNT_0015966309 /DNA_START=427 /DNA_END=847 /DNA_ORIENTATION=-